MTIDDGVSTVFDFENVRSRDIALYVSDVAVTLDDQRRVMKKYRFDTPAQCRVSSAYKKILTYYTILKSFLGEHCGQVGRYVCFGARNHGFVSIGNQQDFS